MVTLEQLKNKIKELMEQDFYPKNTIDSKENVINEKINQKADKTNATQSDAGLMSAEDKIKIDKMDIQIICEGTEINNDGIYLIEKPVFMKAVVKFPNSSTNSVKINFPADDTTDIIIDWGDGTQDIGTPHTNYDHIYDDNTKTYNVIVKGNIKSVQPGICQGAFSEIELKQDVICNSLLNYNSSMFTKITLPTNLSTMPNGFCDGQRQIQNIIIPDNVTTIGHGCFQNCTNLSSITIPNSILTMGDGCFSGCTSLSSIVIPDSVTTLGDGCFHSCASLSSITIPSSVTTIGNACFQNCTNLSSITIPNSITTLKHSCFSNCTNLSSITIPNGITTLDNGCFSGCTSLSSIVIPDSVTTIGNGCFKDCTNLSSITIPSSVTELGYNCVGNDSNLSLIELYWTSIPSSVMVPLKWMIINPNMTVIIPPGTTELYSQLISNAQLVEREE